MPNWCYNSVTLSHGDKTKIDALEAELQKENPEPFNHLCPRPAEEEENWYGWNVNNWGTKWDVTPHDWEQEDDNTIYINFDSAWSPPISLYEFLESEGWSVSAKYHEPGMGFIGAYQDGFDDSAGRNMNDIFESFHGQIVALMRSFVKIRNERFFGARPNFLYCRRLPC